MLTLSDEQTKLISAGFLDILAITLLELVELPITGEAFAAGLEFTAEALPPGYPMMLLFSVINGIPLPA